MSLKLKALGLGLLAAMAVSAIAVVNASATAGGHFVTTNNKHANIVGTVESPHKLHFVNHGLEGEIGCNTQSYVGTTTTETTTSITITPTFGGCTTTSNGQAVTVTHNGCNYTFTVKPGPAESTEHTAHLVCPPGQKIEIHHPNCTLSVHPVTPHGTLTYTTKSAGEIHDITLDVNLTFPTTRHGLCQFIAPTNGVGTLKGEATVRAFHPVTGNQIPLTAT